MAPVTPVLAPLLLDPPVAATITCGRCGGVSDAAMRFCKYCGAALPKEPPPTGERKITRPETPAALQTPTPAAAVVPVASSPTAPLQPSPFAGDAGRAPVTVGGARLVAIAKDGSEGTSWPLLSDQVDLGRDEGDIRLGDDPYVSPRHLRLVRRSDGWRILDLASLNGVYLRVRRPAALGDQD